MRILNYGAGAVGLGIDSCIIKSGHKVDIIARENTVQELRKNGLKRTGIFGDFHAGADTFNAYRSLATLKDESYDVVLVSTKSFDSESSAKDIANHPKLINENTKIVLCQNGWGNAEIFAKYFPDEQIYNARVITGFTRTSPNETKVTVHADAIHIGSLFHDKIEELEELADAITTGGIPCEVTQYIEKDLWAKMLYNCALNPLGALLDVSYGRLGEQDYTRNIMNDIIEEIYNVMNTAGYETHWKSPKDYQQIFYYKLLPSTAGHKSSTLQALKSGKRIEIEALTGIVLKLAGQFHLDTPVNRTIYQMIKAKEIKS